MRAVELYEYMKRVGKWVNWDGGTCDGFKCGDPDTAVTGIAVGWMSTRAALREAHEHGCNLFITHEPTFYAHMDDDEQVFSQAHAREKRNFLASTGMVVYRCHDVWDPMPEIGIVATWARGLGLDGPPLHSVPPPERPPERGLRAEFYAVYPVPRQTAHQLARYIAQRTKPLGQPMVQLVGDPAAEVASLAVGTGAITQVQYMAEELGAEAVLATDDGSSMWRDGGWCLDRGTPLLVVNHATAEEWGMDALAGFVAQRFPEIPVRRVRQGCMYQAVMA